MRNYVIASVLLISCLLFSCSDEITEPVLENVTIVDEDDGLVAYPKQMANTRSLSIEQNWEKWKKVKLAGTQDGDSVHVPWNPYVSAGSVPLDVCRDIKASDGWDLIAHTVNGYGEDGMNYIVFHNKYTGILKVFYYLKAEHSGLQNTAIWEVKFLVPTSCMAFSESYAQLSTLKETRKVYVGNLVDTDSKGYTPGWNCFQIELAYDPELEDGVLQISPTSMSESEIHFDGGLEANTDGLIITANESNVFDGGVKATANYVGKGAEKWAENAVKNGLFGKIKTLIVKGAGSLVQAGISKLLGSFVGGFNQQQETTQTVQLKTSGTITLNGKILEPGTGIGQPVKISLDKNKVGRLGVWSLKDMPTLFLQPFGIHAGQHPVLEYVQLYNIQTPYASPTDLKDKLNINPECLSSVKRYEITGTVYEIGEIVSYDVLGKKYSPVAYEFGSNRTHLYVGTYSPRDILPGVVLKDQNGIDLANFEANAPIEAYIPNTLNGEPGAQPDFTFDSKYIVVVTVRLYLNNQEVVESTHSFKPVRFEWDYSLSPGIYYYSYPYIPIEVNRLAPITINMDSLRSKVLLPRDSIQP